MGPSSTIRPSRPTCTWSGSRERLDRSEHRNFEHDALQLAFRQRAETGILDGRRRRASGNNLRERSVTVGVTDAAPEGSRQATA